VSWSRRQYALSIRINLDSPYADGMPVRTRLGGWLLSYNQENADPAEADWIETKGRRLSRIYITHGHGDHWLGLARLIQRFPGAIGLATAEVLAQAADPAWPGTGKRSSLARFPGPEKRCWCFPRGLSGLRLGRTVVTTPSDPLALLRSRSYVALLVLAAIIGVPVSAAAANFFLALVSKMQGWIFTRCSKAKRARDSISASRLQKSRWSPSSVRSRKPSKSPQRS
jgi:hypothetical protein